MPQNLRPLPETVRRMAGETEAIDLDDALGLASFMISTGRAPHPSEWVESLIGEEQSNVMEGFF